MRDYKTPLEKAKRRTPKSASPKLAKNLGTGEGRENLLERKTGIASRRGDKRATGAFASSPTLDLSLPGSFAIDGPSTTPDADFSLPGSIHIDGGFQVHSPSWDEEDNRAVEAEASETGLIAGDAAVFEAELVDPQEKEEERDRIRREALQEVEKNAAKAEVVDDEAERKRRRQKTLFLVCIACCALLAAIIATTVALTKDDEPDIFILPTSAPTTRAGGLNETLNNCETRPLGLDDFDSPQYAAADWMVQNDTTLIFPIESEEECTRFRQRWAMCVLSFTTNVYGWADRGDWLKPVDICKWFGLVCDGEGLLVGISLRKFLCVRDKLRESLLAVIH